MGSLLRCFETQDSADYFCSFARWCNGSALTIGNEMTVSQANTDLRGTLSIRLSVSLFSQRRRNAH